MIAEPGRRYAYSGAGYCVAGREGELAKGKSIERILQEQICRPPGMRRTAFFPGRIDGNIAAGAVRPGKRLIRNSNAPHLSDPHRFALVGGSIYSTSEDLAKFAQAIANQTGNKRRLLSAKSWNETLESRRKDSSYGLGWTVKCQNGRIAAISHYRSLSSSLATIRVNLPTRCYLVMLFSAVTGPDGSKPPAWKELDSASMK